MTWARWRLAVALVLFCGWVAWIGYQAVRQERGPVVSHAQLLRSAIDVIADVEANPDETAKERVKVVEVLWPPTDSQLKPGQDVSVVNIPSCDGFIGTGRYLLPLTPVDKDRFQIAGLPNTGEFARLRPTVYPDTAGVRRQVARFRQLD